MNGMVSQVDEEGLILVLRDKIAGFARQGEHTLGIFRWPLLVPFAPFSDFPFTKRIKRFVEALFAWFGTVWSCQMPLSKMTGRVARSLERIGHGDDVFRQSAPVWNGNEPLQILRASIGTPHRIHMMPRCVRS